VNFADLQVFKSVVDEGGVIRAANKLHRVPLAVTTRIKQLEASSFTANGNDCISRRLASCCSAMPSG
jgi:hypothetical protein